MRIRKRKFIAGLSSDGLQAVIVAQNEVIAHRSGTDEHFRPAQGICSQGKKTHVSDNVIEKTGPHAGNPKEERMQSFQFKLTGMFIDSLR